MLANAFLRVVAGESRRRSYGGYGGRREGLAESVRFRPIPKKHHGVVFFCLTEIVYLVKIYLRIYFLKFYS